jgi:hypothetical protein
MVEEVEEEGTVYTASSSISQKKMMMTEQNFGCVIF